jgi:hypothetical protein
MEQNCTLCGAPLNPGANFCPSCGGPVAGIAPGAPPAAPGAAGFPATPKKKGLSGLAIVLIVIGVAFVLGGVALGIGAWWIAKQVDFDSETGAFSMQVGDNKMTLRPTSDIDPEEVGVPIYPGATAAMEGEMQLSGGQGEMWMWVFRTNDPAERVVEFYRAALAEFSPSEAVQVRTTRFTYSVRDGEETHNVEVRVEPRIRQTQLMIARAIR